MEDRPQHEMHAYRAEEAAKRRFFAIPFNRRADATSSAWFGLRGEKAAKPKDWRAKWRAARSLNWALGFALAALLLHLLQGFGDADHLMWTWATNGSVFEALAAWVLLLAFLKMIVHTHQPTRSIPWID